MEPTSKQESQQPEQSSSTGAGDSYATAAAKPGKNANKKPARKKTLFIILSVFGIMAIVGVLYWLHASGFEETEDAYITGHTHAISARVSGTVQRVLVDDNQWVKAGQTIAILDTTDYEVALSQAKHNLDVAKAQADTAKTNIPFAERQALAQITQAQAGIAISQKSVLQAQQAAKEAQAAVSSASHMLEEQNANYQKVATDYQRYANVNPEAISAQQLDTAKAAMKMAEANRSSAEAQVAQAKARAAEAAAGIPVSTRKVAQSQGIFQGAKAQELQLEIAKKQYASSVASIKAAEDSVRVAKLNMAYTKIIAPVSGKIGRRTVEVGQRIQQGEPLLSIVSNDIWVVANFKETQLQHMRPGQPVEIHVDAYPDKAFKGKVDSFSPASGAEFALLPPENATGNFTKTVQRIPVKIIFNRKSIRDYETLLVPGLSVIPKVDIKVEPSKRVANGKV